MPFFFHYGNDLRRKIIRKLQVGESLIREQENFVNIQLFMDICTHLHELGFDEKALFKIGQFSAFSNQGTAFAKEFHGFSTPKEVYEHLIPILGVHFEKNHHYSIQKLGNNLCEIHSVPTQDVKDALKSNKVGNLHGCSARRGVASSFALYHDIQNVSVQYPSR